MRPDMNPDRKVRQMLCSARVACLSFGVALLAWALAPAIVQRVASGYAPRLETLAVGSITLLLGLGFIGLCVPVGRGRGWALWTALLIALGLLAAGAGYAVLGGEGPPSPFVLLLAGCTAGTGLLGLEARRPNRRKKRTSHTT